MNFAESARRLLMCWQLCKSVNCRGRRSWWRHLGIWAVNGIEKLSLGAGAELQIIQTESEDFFQVPWQVFAGC